jgi:RNA polymerase sigma-70 factor (ECF subfamily)
MNPTRSKASDTAAKRSTKTPQTTVAVVRGEAHAAEENATEQASLEPNQVIDPRVTRARDGDGAAFEVLLAEVRPRALVVANKVLRNPDDAEDAVQEAFLKAWRNLHRFEGRSSFSTWIHRIVMNIARTKGVREHRTVPFASLVAEADAAEPAVDPNRFQPPGSSGAGHWASPPVPWDEEPETSLSAGETLAAVWRAIAGLPAGQQLVITLRDLEGWASDEVCNALDISETNQRVLLHRARAKVRTALESHFEETVR